MIKLNKERFCKKLRDFTSLRLVLLRLYREAGTNYVVLHCTYLVKPHEQKKKKFRCFSFV